VEREVIDTFLKENNNIPYFEGSAKENINIFETIQFLIKQVVTKLPKVNPSDQITIDKDNKKGSKGDGCC